MLPDNPKRSEIEKAWFDFVSANVDSEFTVTYAEVLTGKDGPRPKPPYITLKIISGPRARGFDELRRKPNSSIFVTGGLRQYTLSIQAFGMGAHDALDNLVARMDDPNASIERKKLVAIVDRGDVVDISALLETGYERRAQLDVIFHAPKNLETEIVPIEHVGVGGTLKQGNQGDHDVGPFTVDKNP